MRRIVGARAHRLNILSAYRGYIDSYTGEELHGWVVRKPSNEGGLRVGLFVSGGLLTSTVANIPRADVKAAGIGSGNCGFAFAVNETVLKAAAADGGLVTVKVLDHPSHEIGRYQLPGRGSVSLPEKGPLIESCRKLLFGDLKELAALFGEVPENPPPYSPPPLAVHEPMFSTRALIPSEFPSALPESKTPAYLEYVRYRYHQDHAFDTEGNPEDRDHFLEWYLTVYGTSRATRGALRVPLSAEDIRYLNEPMIIGGQRRSLSRAMWWRVMKRREVLQNLELSEEGYAGLLYWWVYEEAKEFNFEDCLVPPWMIELLRGVHVSRRGQEFAPSNFMLPFQKSNSELQFFNLNRAEDRQLLVLSMMVMAVRRPDLLRYIPKSSLEKCLDGGDAGASPLERFVQSALRAEKPLPLSRARYAAILRKVGYDLDRQAFTTITDQGHRLHARAMPHPEGPATADVQIIGPFEKASGLGQATRLSASVLAETGLKVNSVNFGLDNPAAEGFSRVGELGEFRRAKINLIHLNAESIPLVYAYGPDVLSGAYNIGYFYWELNTPAPCHYLGMELLDEIWVSTEYGVSIYQPETRKPVTNVGMCFEELDPIDRAEARAFLEKGYGLAGDEFVFFVAFDSFSFVQRKNPLGVISAFQKAFAPEDRVCLAIKTQNRNNLVDPVQHRMWARIEALVARDPRLKIMYETLPYHDLLKLKKGADCYISLHRSEGWGFGMIEAMNLKVPVVCTAYSGNMDFCSEDNSWLVGYTETSLMPDEYIFVRKGQVWAEPDAEEAVRQFRAVREDKAGREAKAEAAWKRVQRDFSARAIAKRYETRLRQILKERDGGKSSSGGRAG